MSTIFTTSHHNLAKPLCLIFSLLLFAIFSSGQSGGSWLQKSSLPANGRAAATAFSIGDKAYVGTGINFNTSGAVLPDFWQYDPTNDVWTQIADFGGGPRGGAVAFVVGGKGYVLTGSNTTAAKQKDIWEYDPDANMWTQKAVMPGVGRNYAVAFTIGSKGYLATGYSASSNLDDFWQYDPATDVWIQKADVPGSPRSSAMGFGIGGNGYVGAGYINGYVNDFWKYDTISDSWTQIANAGVTPRSDGTSFVLNEHGFICNGATNMGLTNELLEYDPVSDIWTTRAPFPGLGKEDVVAFSVGEFAYVGTGYDDNFNQTTGLYQYTPDSSFATYTEQLIPSPQVLVMPNPLIDGGAIIVNSNIGEAMIAVELVDETGKNFPLTNFEKLVAGNQFVVHFSKNNIASGIYFLLVKADKHVIATTKVMVL